MAAEIYNDDDYFSSRSPPLVPVCPQSEFSASQDRLLLLPSRSSSPWELRPVYFVLFRINRKLRQERQVADLHSRTPSPENPSNPRGRKRYRQSPALQGDSILVDITGGLNHPDVASRAGEEALPQSDDSDLEEMASSRSIRGLDLPMIIQGSTIISRPDSGSEDNI